MSAHLSEAERDELAEFIGEWRTTCRLMGVAYTPKSIAQWLSDIEVAPRIIAARVAAAVAAEREAWVGKIEALADAWADDTGIEGYINLGEAEDRLRALIAEARS